jgi:hypothetical protein
MHREARREPRKVSRSAPPGGVTFQEFLESGGMETFSGIGYVSRLRISRVLVPARMIVDGESPAGVHRHAHGRAPSRRRRDGPASVDATTGWCLPEFGPWSTVIRWCGPQYGSINA